MDKDARYFPHDDNARTDPKIEAMVNKYKMEGYGRYWVIIENLRADRTHKIQEKDYVYESLAKQMDCSVDEVKEFIQDCITKYELFVQEDGFFYSESLLRRMAKLEAMRDKNRSAAYIMHHKYGHNITKDPNEPQD